MLVFQIQETEPPISKHRKQDGQPVALVEDKISVLPKIERSIGTPRGGSQLRRSSLYRSVHQKNLAQANYMEV